MQVTGSMKCTEVTLGSEEDDYITTVTCDKDEQKYSCLVEAIKRLRPAVVKRLLQFDEEFKTLPDGWREGMVAGGMGFCRGR